MLEAVLLAFVGTVSRSSNKDTGSYLSRLRGRGGITIFFLTTLASSKNLTYSSSVWNLHKNNFT